MGWPRGKRGGTAGQGRPAAGTRAGEEVLATVGERRKTRGRRDAPGRGPVDAEEKGGAGEVAVAEGLPVVDGVGR